MHWMNTSTLTATTDKQALQKCRSAPPIISLQAKTQISLTTVAGQSSMDLVAEGLKTWL
jgi:hypothetical protein